MYLMRRDDYIRLYSTKVDIFYRASPGASRRPLQFGEGNGFAYAHPFHVFQDAIGYGHLLAQVRETFHGVGMPYRTRARDLP